VTEDQFNKLCEDNQSNIISERGALISLRRTDEHRVLLYQIDSFYVEVYYHPTKNVIKIKSFSGTEQLQPYLNQISLEGIM
jgi:hypothetical protein